MQYLLAVVQSIALRYSPDGYVSRGKVMLRRRVAGDSFLSGLLKHGGSEKVVALVHNENDAKDCVGASSGVRACGSPIRVEVARLDSPQAVAQAGVMYLPGPGLEEYALWWSWAGNQRSFALWGITHTTATARVMGALARCLVAPVQPWDATI